MLPLGFCVITPIDYPMYLSKPAIESALSEVAAARGLVAKVLYIESGYGVSMWRWLPWQPMRLLKAQGLCQVALVGGIGGFAGGYIDEGYAVLGEHTLWSIQWGQLPYCGLCLSDSHWIYYSRNAQKGAILHEVDHLLCRCRDLGHTRGTMWWDLFPRRVQHK